MSAAKRFRATIDAAINGLVENRCGFGEGERDRGRWVKSSLVFALYQIWSVSVQNDENQINGNAQ